MNNECAELYFKKIHSEETELLHADGRLDRQTDRQMGGHDKRVVVFRSFKNTPKNMFLVNVIRTNFDVNGASICSP